MIGAQPIGRWAGPLCRHSEDDGLCLLGALVPLIIVDSIHSTPECRYTAVLAVCFVWLLVGTAISTMTEQRLSWARSAVISVVAVVVISGITFTYIR